MKDKKKLLHSTIIHLLVMIIWTIVFTLFRGFVLSFEIFSRSEVSVRQLNDDVSSYADVIQNKALWDTANSALFVSYLVILGALVLNLAFKFWKFYQEQFPKEGKV